MYLVYSISLKPATFTKKKKAFQNFAFNLTNGRNDKWSWNWKYYHSTSVSLPTVRKKQFGCLILGSLKLQKENLRLTIQIKIWWFCQSTSWFLTLSKLIWLLDHNLASLFLIKMGWIFLKILVVNILRGFSGRLHTWTALKDATPPINAVGPCRHCDANRKFGLPVSLAFQQHFIHFQSSCKNALTARQL